MANYHRPKDEIKLVALPVVDKEEKLRRIRREFRFYERRLRFTRTESWTDSHVVPSIRVDLSAERIRDFWKHFREIYTII